MYSPAKSASIKKLVGEARGLSLAGAVRAVSRKSHRRAATSRAASSRAVSSGECPCQSSLHLGGVALPEQPPSRGSGLARAASLSGEWPCQSSLPFGGEALPEQPPSRGSGLARAASLREVASSGKQPPLEQSRPQRPRREQRHGEQSLRHPGCRPRSHHCLFIVGSSLVQGAASSRVASSGERPSPECPRLGSSLIGEAASSGSSLIQSGFVPSGPVEVIVVISS